MRHDAVHSFGSPVYKEEDFDYLRIIVATVPDRQVEGQHTLNVLHALLAEGLDADARIQELRDLEIPVSSEVEKEVSDMTAYFEGMAQSRYDKGREEGRAEGRTEGREEGRAEGRAEGREEGRAEGREEGVAKMVCKAYRKGQTAEQIMDMFDLTSTEVIAYLNTEGILIQ